MVNRYLKKNGSIPMFLRYFAEAIPLHPYASLYPHLEIAATALIFGGWIVGLSTFHSGFVLCGARTNSPAEFVLKLQRATAFDELRPTNLARLQRLYTAQILHSRKRAGICL
ncbi:MAG: hypothetical protein UY63_C0011G0021 [Parcubacteria group bacterium GW2011_GWA2_51_10]|nr:MAG: hypothetical protein UY63_C0011G0021 [Parcubacteria group bacterium GW2011_GWA2_51_10]